MADEKMINGKIVWKVKRTGGVVTEFEVIHTTEEGSIRTVYNEIPPEWKEFFNNFPPMDETKE